MSRFVEAGGIRWHVQQTGRGPPLLLVHGTGASTHSWRDLMPILATEYSVTAADLPGHGFTGGVGAARSSIAGMSGSMADLLRTLQIAPEYCVGHSAGAVILCRMALDRHIAPRIILSINGAFVPLAGAAGVLYSPIARFLAASPLASRLIARRARNAVTVAHIIANTGSTLDAAGIELYARLVSNPGHLVGTLRMMGNWDLRAFERELPRLETPLALMVGENDRTVAPRQALEVQQLVAHAAIYGLPGLGHLAHEERPALVAQEILKICRAAGC
jgi:magnesium chelatase accessory protein